MLLAVSKTWAPSMKRTVSCWRVALAPGRHAIRHPARPWRTTIRDALPGLIVPGVYAPTVSLAPGTPLRVVCAISTRRVPRPSAGVNRIVPRERVIRAELTGRRPRARTSAKRTPRPGWELIR